MGAKDQCDLANLDPRGKVGRIPLDINTYCGPHGFKEEDF